MSDEEPSNPSEEKSSASPNASSPNDDVLSLTDLIDQLDRAAFMASLAHRGGWRSTESS